MICIDESGDLGRGGRFFVIASVQMDNSKRLKNLVKNFCTENSVSEIKGSLLTVPERQSLINGLNYKRDYHISYLVFDKKNFHRKDILGKNILFNYLSSFLFEKICRSHNSNEIDICFDNRTVKTKAKHALPEYLKTKMLEWDIEKDVNISFSESHSHKGIQIADLIANTIFQRYKNNKRHFYNQLNIKESIKFPYKTFGQ